MKICTLFALLLATTGISSALAEDQKNASLGETKYLVFQVWPAQPGYPEILPRSGHLTLSKSEMDQYVRDVAGTIGLKGDAHNKLGFTVGPLSFDVTDDQTRQWIRDAFAVARDNDVAVAFHIDDSMSWGSRTDLLPNPDNIETSDWKQTPNSARSLHWGRTPTKFPPQMCYNAPAIVAVAKARAALIGAEVKHELDALKAEGREHLFAGIFAGWETAIGTEYGTNLPLGYRAMAHRGFSESKLPANVDAERVSIVSEWIELWANSLCAAGAPREKMYCHIAFTDQGLRKATATESYAEKVGFSVPDVAFSKAYRPGFSTYPEGHTFKQVHEIVQQHGSPAWISAEGTNVSPTSMPGEPTMETYLGRVYNHGGVLVNLYSWGIGGEAQRNINFFRKATENPEALAAYGKFLRGEKLVESSAGFSAEAFQAKMQRIQAEMPPFVQKTGKQAQVMPMIQNLQALTKARKWQEADKQADELLNLLPPPGQGTLEASFDDETRKHILHELGGPFFVSRDKVQADLKVNESQKHELSKVLTVHVQEGQAVLEKLQNKEAKEKEKTWKSHCQVAGEKLEAALNGILNADQLKRFQQLKLQYEIPAIMLQPTVAKELKITDAQRQQSMAAVMEMQQEVKSLMKQAKTMGSAQDILPKVIKLRVDCQSKIELYLTDEQKKKWHEMIGQPLIIW